MTPEERDRLSKLEESNKNVVEWVRDIHKDVRMLVDISNQSKGGLRMLVYSAGAVGGLSGLLSSKIGAVIFTALKGGS